MTKERDLDGALDDGLVHVTRDGGKNWANVTPKGHAGVDPDPTPLTPPPSTPAPPTSPGPCTSPTISVRTFTKTNDFGKTWKKIVNGIPAASFTARVREDPNPQGLAAG